MNANIPINGRCIGNRLGIGDVNRFAALEPALLYDDRVIRTPRLEIPHPRMHKRAFVLQPICDINPSIIHPELGQTVADLLSHLDDEDQRVIPLENQPILL